MKAIVVLSMVLVLGAMYGVGEGALLLSDNFNVTQNDPVSGEYGLNYQLDLRQGGDNAPQTYTLQHGAWGSADPRQAQVSYSENPGNPKLSLKTGYGATTNPLVSLGGAWLNTSYSASATFDITAASGGWMSINVLAADSPTYGKYSVLDPVGGAAMCISPDGSWSFCVAGTEVAGGPVDSLDVSAPFSVTFDVLHVGSDYQVSVAFGTTMLVSDQAVTAAQKGGDNLWLGMYAPGTKYVTVDDLSIVTIPEPLTLTLLGLGGLLLRKRG